jgi:putative spermidine/putrescine transport system ATP-binding protein
MASIEVADLTKRFGATHAVGPVSFAIRSGEFVSLLGPSGCGKTTTLRMIAGFEEPSAGSIRIGEADMNGVPVERRGIGMVFQSYALFPHLSVSDNVAFGLRLRRMERAAVTRLVNETLDMVGLAGLAARMPRELSGGQQQRVALARALAVRPSVLLLDEPLSNLDLKLREQMRDEIRRLQRELAITALYVTHDQSEAMAMSDRIAVMNKGTIEQLGSPRDIYESPKSVFVARFIGQCTVLEGRVTTADLFTARSGASLRILPRANAGEAGLVIRPEFVRLLPDGEDGAINTMDATVADAVYVGERVNLTLRLAQGDSLLASGRAIPGKPLPLSGDRLRIAIAPEEMSLVPLGEAARA